MDTREVNYDDKHFHVHLVVSEATTLVGMRRYRLVEEAREYEKDHPISDPDVRVLSLQVFPTLISAVTSGEIICDDVKWDWPITAEQFLQLPEQLWDRWSDVVYDLNPHWLPKESAKKEASVEKNSTTD